MKKLFTLIALTITLITSAQAPQGFNYQATVRNSSGALIINQNVYFKFNIMLNSQTSVPVYSETHYVPTDDLGQVNLVVGTGTATTGTFSTINWANGTYYLGIELNTGTGYVAMGTTQLLSVPYALYANTAGNSQLTTPNLGAVLAVNNSANNLQIKNLADPTDLQDAVTKSYSDTQLFTQIDSLHTQIDSLQAQITALVNATAAPLPNVTIGNQIWQSTNLDVTTYRDGTPIPQVTDPTQWANLTTGAWCYYNNDPANGPIYGKLYNGYAVEGIYDTASLNNPSLRKQLAPVGWHIPTSSNWIQLVDFLGGEFVAGKKLKSIGKLQDLTGLWAAYISPGDPLNEQIFSVGTNESGFTAFPGGCRIANGTFNFINYNGTFWYYPFNGSVARNLDSTMDDINFLGTNSKAGFSIRCIKD